MEAQALPSPSSMISYHLNGSILTIDENFTPIFGYHSGEVQGRLLQEVILVSPYREAFTAILANYVKTGNPEFCGRTIQLEAVKKDSSIVTINLTQSETGDGDSRCFIANLEVAKEVSCIISFDLFGSILMARGSCSKILEFFGEKELKGKKIFTFVPDLKPSPIQPDGKPTYHHLIPLLNGRTMSMNVKVVGKEETREMTLELATKNIGVNSTTIFNGTFKQWKPKMEIIFLLDASNRIVSCNRQVSSTLGYSVDQLKGQNIDIIFGETTFYPSKTNDSGEGPLKKRKSLNAQNSFIWKEENGAKILEVKHQDKSTMMVVCITLPVDGSLTCWMMRKLEGTDQVSQELPIVGKYIIGEFIAAGNYGKVKKANRIDSGALVAVKIINKKLMNEEEEARAMREIEILRKLEHPNIIHFFEMVDTRDRLYLFMEYIDGGHTLKNFIDKGLSEREAKTLFRPVAAAITYCHSMQVVHRDIKPTNVLINVDGHVKLIDFGLGAISEAGKLQGTFCGSPAYAAPEIIQGNRYMGPAADVWSLGVLLYAMVANRLPFDCLGKILQCNWIPVDAVSNECNDLLNNMIVYEPDQRITMPQIMLHPWLSS